jgi:hypothetical protein
MPLSGGQTFAGYRVIRLLGSGGMGEVYLAQHPRLPRRDALKLLPHAWSADSEYRARFMREADLASTLWHPHIVGVHDRGEEAGQLWISMDFVDGLDAARLLADRYPSGMPVEDVVRVVTAVAGALDHAHKQGLLHRDGATRENNRVDFAMRYDRWVRPLITVFGAGPNRTAIRVADGTLDVKFGRVFRMTVALQDIRSARCIDEPPWPAIGVHLSGDGWLVNGSRHGIVELRFARPVKPIKTPGGRLLGGPVHSLSLSLTEP